MESIVLKLLEPDRRHRYQSAAQVREDLERQLANLPLRYAPDRSISELARKWCRRHPRLKVGVLVAAIAGIGLLLPLTAIAVRKIQVETVEARQTWRQEVAEAKSVQVLLATRYGERARLEEGLDRGKAVLAKYGIDVDPLWREKPVVSRLPAEDRQSLRLECGEMLLFMAVAEAKLAGDERDPAARDAGLRTALQWNELAAASYPPNQAPQRLIELRSQLHKDLKDEADGGGLPVYSSERTAEYDAYHAGAKHAMAGRYREALQTLVPFTEDHPEHFQSWFLRGICHDNLEQNREALACWTACAALGFDRPIVYFNRGLVRLREQEFAPGWKRTSAAP